MRFYTGYAETIAYLELRSARLRFGVAIIQDHSLIGVYIGLPYLWKLPSMVLVA